jgi:PEP-CTERM motif
VRTGQACDILDWSSLAGRFSSINLPTLADLTWSISRLYTMGVISVGLAGDHNNGIVDAADYVVWRKGLGTTYTQTDYDVWRAHFGQTAGSGSGANASIAVPEPATFVLFLVGLLAMVACGFRGESLNSSRLSATSSAEHKEP